MNRTALLFSVLTISPLFSMQKVQERLSNHLKGIHLSSVQDVYLRFKTIYNWDTMDITRPDPFGRCPLHKAVFHGQKQGIDVLLARGCDVNEHDKWGYTALHFAIDRQHVKIAKTLVLEHGALVNLATKDGITPLHLACEPGNLVFVRLLLEQGARPNAQDELGLTALHRACRAGNSEIAKYLLHYAPKETHNNTKKKFSHEKADVTICTRTGDTPLHLAAAHCQTDMVNMLLEMGASINQANNQGVTPLHVVCEHPGHFDTVQLLLQKGARTAAREKAGLTALHMACRGGKIDIVQYLLHYTPEGTPPEKFPHEKVDSALCTNQEFTALHFAAGYGHAKLTHFLIAEIGLSVHATTKKNIMPLYLATMGGWDDAIKVLIEHGALVDFVVENGTTPLSLAKKENYKTTVALLLREKLKDKLAALERNTSPEETSSTTQEIEGKEK